MSRRHAKPPAAPVASTSGATGADKPFSRSILLSMALLIAGGTALSAQTSGHERVGVRVFRNCELTVSAGLDATAVATARGRGISLSTSLAAEFLFSGTWNLCATLPYSVLVVPGRESRFPLTSAPGDPEISLGFTSRLDRWRLGTDLSWSRPLGISDPVRGDILGFSSGSGSDSFTVLFRANRFLDPLSFGSTLTLSYGMPRRDGPTAAEGSLLVKAGVSVTEALNRNALLGLSLTQSFSAGTDAKGIPDGKGFRYGATGGASLTLSDGRYSLRIGGSMNIANPPSSGSVYVIVSRTIALGRKT